MKEEQEVSVPASGRQPTVQRSDSFAVQTGQGGEAEEIATYFDRCAEADEQGAARSRETRVGEDRDLHVAFYEGRAAKYRGRAALVRELARIVEQKREAARRSSRRRHAAKKLTPNRPDRLGDTVKTLSE